MRTISSHSLVEQLDQLTVTGTFFEPLDGNRVKCYACAHQCVLKPGQRGVCRVRFNEKGVLKVPWGYTTGMALDPVEKKPFNHFLPGSLTLSFGMLGCNFTCEFCQNWITAQAVNEPYGKVSPYYLQPVTPAEVVAAAIRNRAKAIISTYNEPWITADWSEAIFTLAKKKGLRTGYVSNGFATHKGLDTLKPNLDALKVDLKCGTESHYRELGGRLADVIDTIAYAQELGIWVEVVTLVIPGWNDSPDELWAISRSIASISPNTPWHVTAFHPDYKMQEHPPTSPDELLKASEIGQEAGLIYVYAGNLPGRVGSLENTHCPQCLKPVIIRRGFTVTHYHLTPDGHCEYCGTPIPGVWDTEKPSARRFAF
ncbi:MAG: AmmeMemoRadiSam system radical SAM enzyme [Anaerolineae bacterium]|nr:AmmeMemoRadiSam system radical SAM enzyme [Anaerolineae bacterium]